MKYKIMFEKDGFGSGCFRTYQRSDFGVWVGVWGTEGDSPDESRKKIEELVEKWKKTKINSKYDSGEFSL